jgi:Xaa-Pro aminopeptidase
MTLLLYAAPEKSADLFHAIPAGIGDPFLYAEDDGRRVAYIGVLDADKARAAGVEVRDPTVLGRDELLASGAGPLEIEVEVCLRACRDLGLAAVRVPADFPLAVADHLRGGGVDVAVDDDAFVARRRRKTPEQIAGLRRAQRAADAAMGTAAALIRELRPGLTSEEVRAAMAAVCAEHGAELPEDVIVAHGEQGARGHDEGSGPIGAGEPVVVDIWPRDDASRVYADMTRTFVAGGGAPPDELRAFWEATRAALDAVMPGVRAGASARALFEASCEPYHAIGQPTQLSKEPGTVLEDGYFHSLGHGIGLEVHERPYLGRGPDVLVAGDAITIEPGCYRRGFGGCRLEDLVLVTEDGCEVLTDFPYDL